MFTAILLLGLTTSVKASPDTIYVPGDYAKIQWAIGNATTGDAIIVSAGIYYEHVIIDKSLTIMGENGNAILDGNGTSHVVTICADNVNLSGLTIQNSGPGFWDGAIYAYNSSWCNISHNILVHSGHGIWFDHDSNNNIITGNNVSYNLVGIVITSSNSNIITNNYVFSSTYCGIAFSGASSNILTSNIAKNNEYGIWLDYSTNVTAIGNMVTDNLFGIHLDHSDNNVISHNNIINNTHQTEIIDSASIWNYDLEGNYWSDYDGVDIDQDGIGDKPRIIDANNTDNYPLMGMFSDFEVIWEEETYHVTTICNSTISAFQFNQEERILSFNVTGPYFTVGFCRITIPKALINETYTVLVDGEQVDVKVLPISNSTHAFLYFTYIHSTHEVVIIPEFPPTLILILILFMITTLIVIIITKKKASRTPH
jgi:parallel beta-helix repeat protein